MEGKTDLVLVNSKAQEDSAVRAKAGAEGRNQRGQDCRYHAQKFGMCTGDSR